jgi:imidazolonepropionase-like amidohydrolase
MMRGVERIRTVSAILRLIAATVLLTIAAGAGSLDSAQPTPGNAPAHGIRPKRLLVRNVMVVYGNARPAFGPMDVLVEDGLIAEVRRPRGDRSGADAVIDGTGKYLLPGFVNTHMHWHEERAPGLVQPIQYERNLYLAAGVTTARELGGDFEKSRKWRAESAAGSIAAPRMIVYVRPSMGRRQTPDEIRAGVREAREKGADGLKLMSLDRDQLEAVLGEARRLGLPTTAHIGVEETTARDYIELGVTSIEHFYGIADAAIEGIQRFPADMNYSDEVQRFARAGELYAQADRARLDAVIDLMVEKGVAWSPTLSIYEAARDLVRHQNLPWYREYLHPALLEFWRPDAERHGSFFVGWTNTQEVRWRENYRIWMAALRRFGVNGGLITTGDDAGYIWSLYGFGLVRELELHEEAGFHPLEVIKHATVNGARLVGLGDRLGRVRVGYLADLLVVNGNPLENLHVLNPAGADINVNGQNVRGGGIEWTIKDGIPYHGPTLMREVREMVELARGMPKDATPQTP